MYKVGDFIITLDETSLWESDRSLRQVATLPKLSPAIIVSPQSPRGMRMLCVLTSRGVGWIPFYVALIILDEAGDIVDLEQQGYENNDRVKEVYESVIAEMW